VVSPTLACSIIKIFGSPLEQFPGVRRNPDYSG
jgi:hypothetical protein